MYRTISACLALSLLAPALPGQIADARSAWAGLSSNLIGAAARVPEADYSFRPTPEVRSFAQLIGHVADAHFMFCAPLFPQGTARSGFEKLTSKAELLAALKDSVNFCTNAADRVVDGDTTTAKLFGRDLAKLSILWANIAHSAEHYGNVVTYLRLKGIVPPSSDPASRRARLLFDKAHGEFGPPAGLAEIASRAGFAVSLGTAPISSASLKSAQILYVRTPSKEFAADEKRAITGYVNAGGSLLLVVDEEQRQPLAATGVNDLLQPFGMKLTPDTPYLHNCGALAKAGEINRADREIPYSGGRAVEGGTPFAYQLDKDGRPAQPFAAWKKVEGGGRIVVMGEAMASLFLGVPDAQRLSGIPRDAQGTKYWGKDSTVFMEEVLAWLVQR